MSASVETTPVYYAYCPECAFWTDDTVDQRQAEAWADAHDDECHSDEEDNK